MKKNVFAFAVLFLLVMVRGSFAGDYHNQAGRRWGAGEVTLACAQCHTMHGTQGGGTVFNLIYSTTTDYDIFPKLIRADSVVNLCRFCHAGFDSYGIGVPILFSPIYNASAGDFSDVEDNRHSILATDADNYATPPGFVGTWATTTALYDSGLSCEFCHDQHGNKNYRNLRPNPLDPSARIPGTDGVEVTYCNEDSSSNINTCLGGEAVVQATIDGDADGSYPPSGQFSTSNIRYRSSTKQIAGFCGQCHVNFYEDPVTSDNSKLGGSPTGDSGTNTQWKRHPVGGIKVGIGNGHTDPQPVDKFGVATTFDLGFPVPNNQVPRVINPTNTDPGDEQPFCFTCHRVHGSRNHSNLIFGGPDDSTETDGGGWGTMMRDTCQQCHNQ